MRPRLACSAGTGRLSAAAPVLPQIHLADHVSIEDFETSETSATTIPHLGGFDAIAHYHGGQGKRVHDFKIGGDFRWRRRGEEIVRSVRSTFRERTGQPVLSWWSATQDETRLIVNAADREKIRVQARRGNAIVFDERVREPRSRAHLALDAFLAARTQAMEAEASGQATQRPSWSGIELFELLPGGPIGDPPPRPFASAPDSVEARANL